MYTVSVIIPIYNVERFIERCAISLFEQSLSNMEFIFINDKSPDNSMEILRNITLKYPLLNNNIKIIEHKQNLGLSATRITGIKAAQGKYIAFCDSDDWVEHDMFNKLYCKAEKNAYDIVYCNYIIEYPNKSIKPSLINVKEIRDYQLRQLCGYLPCFSWIRLYKRDILLRHINELYIPGVNMWEDSMMNIILSFYIDRVAFVDYAGYHYNQCNLNAYTTAWSEASKNNIFTVIDQVTSFINDKTEFSLPLKFYRISALYSIISHSNLPQIRSLNWPWISDIKFVWKHPNMPTLNKCLCILYKMRCYNIVIAIIRFKKIIKLLVWGK